MTTFGIVAPAAIGHFNPMSALAHQLQMRGHRAVFLLVSDWREKVEAEGFGYYPVLEVEYPVGTWASVMERLSALDGLANLRFTIACYRREAEALFRDVPTAVEAEGIEALIVDQTTRAGGTVAEHLGLPFITVCCALALNREPDIPPPLSPWGYQPDLWGRVRNKVGYAALDWFTRSTWQTLQQQRRQWNLPLQASWNDTNSPFAQLSQQPAAFDFPRRHLPECFHYIGPLRGPSRSVPAFPFELLDGRPLVYASLGTIQNRRTEVFQMIAMACAQLEVQLVIAHGGGLQESVVAQLPGNPIAVSYAPQLELIRRAAVVITHAGLNTTLDALSYGVPLVAIPQVHEQPAIARRILWTGTGEVIWPSTLTPDLLRSAVTRLLGNSAYREAAQRMQASINPAEGVRRAADICEAVVKGQPVT